MKNALREKGPVEDVPPQVHHITNFPISLRGIYKISI